MSIRLTHVRANVTDLRRAIAWYRDVLGFEVKNLWPPDEPNYADFQYETGAQFSIMEAEPVPTGARFNFDVDDVEAWWARLEDRAQVVEPLFETAYGTQKFTIQDPDGNELGFVQA